MLTTKEILTREEVMEILKIGRSTFYRLLQTGELKGFKEGNRYKVPVESVEKYVEMKMKAYEQGAGIKTCSLLCICLVLVGNNSIGLIVKIGLLEAFQNLFHSSIKQMRNDSWDCKKYVEMRRNI